MKHYLIDSENVGDFWIPLLELPADQAELIVFYTKNSPHMSYDSLIKLKESDRTVTFIKCYEGTNALDFQLCSELGFLIATHKGDDFIIVTNDTGYDAAVKYWRHKEYSVKRIAGKDSRTGGRRRGNTARTDVAGEVSSILHKLVSMPDVDEKDDDLQTEPAAVMETEASPESYSEPAYEENEEPDMASDDADELSDELDQEEEDYDAAGDEYLEESESAEEEYDGEEESYEDEEQEEEEFSDEETEEESEEETDPVTKEEDTAEPEEEEQEIDEPEALPAESTDEDAPAEEPANENEPEQAPGAEEAFTPDPEEITVIVNCIKKENLAELHNQLIQFYGDKGKDIYQSIKSGALNIERQNWDKEEKFLYYCALIFRHSDEPAEALQEENIREFSQFLLGAENKRKNLNSLRYALLKHYGKEKGRRYYFMLKPYVKALNQM